MELGISLQLYQGATALLIGMGAGLYYDLLKTLRRGRGRRAVVTFFDLLYWLGLVFVLFLQTMIVGLGLVRLFMLVANVLGAGLYFMALSGAVCFVLGKILDGLSQIIRFFAAPVRKLWSKGKKVANGVKKDFIKWGKHNIILTNYAHFRRRRRMRDGKGGGSDAAQKGKYFYEAGGVGPGHLRLGELDRSTRADRGRERKSLSSRAGRSGTGSRKRRL